MITILSALTNQFISTAIDQSFNSHLPAAISTLLYLTIFTITITAFAFIYYCDLTCPYKSININTGRSGSYFSLSIILTFLYSTIFSCYYYYYYYYYLLIFHYDLTCLKLQIWTGRSFHSHFPFQPYFTWLSLPWLSFQSPVLPVFITSINTGGSMTLHLHHY